MVKGIQKFSLHRDKATSRFNFLQTLNVCKTLIFLVCVFLLTSGVYLSSVLTPCYYAGIQPVNEVESIAITLLLTIAFIFTSAVPFVPGAEIGLGMMLMLGEEIAPLVYIAMVGALTISFQIGKNVPINVTASVFGFLGLSKAQHFALKLGLLTPQKRLELLLERTPSRILPFLLRHRYLSLILLINLPGNSLVGGGGGIAFVAGLCGLFTFPKYVLAISLAVLPVPATYYLMA